VLAKIVIYFIDVISKLKCVTFGNADAFLLHVIACCSETNDMKQSVKELP